MSAARPNCGVCLGPHVKEINTLLAQGTKDGRISRMLKARAARATRHGRGDEVKAHGNTLIREHRLYCLGAGLPGDDPDGPSYVSSPEIPGVGKPPPISVSAAEMADPAKRLDLLREALAQKIGDLTAKELYAMYMAELKLQTAQAEKGERGASRDRGGEDDGFDDAVAAAAGHRPDLRVVGRK